MIKLQSKEQIDAIQTGDIVVKYPLEGAPTDSFAGRNLHNSIAYEVAGKNAETRIVELSAPGKEEETNSIKAVQKSFDELLADKVWWVAKY